MARLCTLLAVKIEMSDAKGQYRAFESLKAFVYMPHAY